ncbi:MAG: hypothetical protein UV04_C0044G0009 [Candidatus Gottesmanbacteria bacterium GW2011_GWA2_42_16]|nr:MAG: hypothetical protein UV04_C0044G0009 [Candidatus Gottesmanbacteria bacterium GW2011_GWA2_42_16]
MVIGQNGGVVMKGISFPRGIDRLGMDVVSVMALELRTVLPNLYREVNGSGSSTRMVPIRPDEIGAVVPTKKAS